MRKPKFKPEITRVKLNPEQAVLQCTCYNTGSCIAAGKRSTLQDCSQGEYKLGSSGCRQQAMCNVAGS